MPDDPQPAGSACPAYRPDHNGECLTCDEPADQHPNAQRDLAERLAWSRQLDLAERVQAALQAALDRWRRS